MRLPSTVLSKAMRLPSGDHAGWASKASARLVRVRAPDPSTLTTYTDAGTIRPALFGSPEAAGAGVLSGAGVGFELWLNTATARMTTATATATTAPMIERLARRSNRGAMAWACSSHLSPTAVLTRHCGQMGLPQPASAQRRRVGVPCASHSSSSGAMRSAYGRTAPTAPRRGQGRPFGSGGDYSRVMGASSSARGRGAAAPPAPPAGGCARRPPP